MKKKIGKKYTIEYGDDCSQRNRKHSKRGEIQQPKKSTFKKL